MNCNFLISIIVCSTNIELRNQLHQNIIRKIGCDFEFLFKDNMVNKDGLCSVYNSLASRAKGDFLCFVHEDVLIETPNWGEILIDKAKELTTGVIGFAGSKVFNGLPFWHNKSNLHYSFIQQSLDGDVYTKFCNKSIDDFSEVKVLDGMFLFCRKEVWNHYKFDENLFKKFHVYDVDFSFNVSNKYINYVCNSILIRHFSLGKIDYEYYKEISVMYGKWKKSPNMDDFDHDVDLIESVVHEMVYKNHISIINTLKFLKNITAFTRFNLCLAAVYFSVRFKLSLLKSKF